ncbi:MAG: DUF5686 and carboxypeptidase regulatory-like domain-containing protein [Flavobacteriales bacterium]|nr:DUF5686 and carboxypeptidase regulatory-like domain-containing protein [Flavobacteriales bacterium]
MKNILLATDAQIPTERKMIIGEKSAKIRASVAFPCQFFKRTGCLMPRSIIFICLFLCANQSFAQQTISGFVRDSLTNEPLVFAHVVLNDGPRGTTTDLNGFFKIQTSGSVSYVRIKYIGFETRKFPVGAKTDSLVFNLPKSNMQLAEVIILPGENPADRIIKNVVKNRKENDPANLPFFSYKAYEKTIFTLDEDTAITNKRSTQDTMVVTIRNLLEKQHIMMSENVYERKYHNGKYTDNVEATRFSGMKNPQFAMLASQMQSFSFYKDYFTLGQQAFLGPISPNSSNNYFFNIEDTLMVEQDTIIIISYQPKKGKKFDALQGQLHINITDFALMNASANVVDGQGVEIKIQHRYEKLNGETWFPTQLNTDFKMLGLNLGGFNIKGVGTTYNREVNLDEKIRALDISTNTLELDSKAHKKDSAYWSSERETPLSEKELRTYHVIDSMGKELKLEQRIKLLIAFGTGRFPIGPVELDLDKIIDFNDYEGFRLGVGLHTAPDLIKWANFGAYVAYGFKDKEVKYGGDTDFTLHKNLGLQLRGAYYHDVREIGAQEFLVDENRSLSSMYSDLVIQRMDLMNGWNVGVRINPLRGWHFEAQFRHQDAESKHGYRYVPENTTDSLTKAQYAEVRVGFRFAPFEKKMRLGAREIIQDKGAVILWATVTKGLKGILSSDFDYWKADVKLDGKFRIRKVGMEFWQLSAGWISNPVPYLKMYTPKANYDNQISVFSPNSFETVRPNEFLNQYQIALHQRHNFGSVKTGIKWIRPDFNWVNSFGIGWLTKPQIHSGLKIQDMSKGIFETGIVIDDIIKVNLLGIGGGVFYRYGAYAFSREFDNLAFKLSMKIGF